MRHLWAPVLALMLLTPSAAQAEKALRVTVEQVVDRALAKGLELRETEAEVEAAQAEVRAAKALYGPRVMVEGKAIYFSRRPTFELDLGGDDMPLALEQMMGSLLPAGPMEAGEQYTVDFSVTVAQPLTKLESIRELVQIKGLEVEVAKVHGEQTKVEMAFKVREASYQLLQIRDTVKTLEETEQEILARQKQVEAFRAAELVGPQEVLEITVKLAELRQGLIKARTFEKVIESGLRVLARVEPGTAIELAEPVIPPAPPPLAECIAAAQKARPELAELRLRGKQADLGVRAKMQEYLPEISLVATYQYQAGSTFGTPEFAVGAVMSWTPFAWGETYHALRAAKATARRARYAQERVGELLGLDVEAAYASADSARQSISVAEVGLEQAQELYRIERARFELHDNTATDLLSAQTALLRAQSSLRSARYDYLTALASLRRAMGEM